MDKTELQPHLSLFDPKLSWGMRLTRRNDVGGRAINGKEKGHPIPPSVTVKQNSWAVKWLCW